MNIYEPHLRIVSLKVMSYLSIYTRTELQLVAWTLDDQTSTLISFLLSGEKEICLEIYT